MVKVFSGRTLADELTLARFDDIVQPDIGAKPNIVFLVATKPR